MGKRKNVRYPLRKTLVHVGKYPSTDLDRINETRQEFIQSMIATSQHKLEYIGELDPNDVNFPSTFQQPTGQEEALEYHLFRMVEHDTMVVHRWRLYKNV